MFDRFGPDDADDYEAARKRMVEAVSRHVDDERVLEALEAVPRHEFVPENRRRSAYADQPLPIGDGQTISAPHMVAIMADELALEPGENVLEIGTGCGYHAAVTAELVGAAHVYSVEYSEELADHAPYDAVYFTCAATGFPEPVVDQTRPGGRLLAPIGTAFQTLVKATKREDGSLARSEHGGVQFVRMRG